MQRIDLVDGKTVHDSLLDHDTRAAAALFGGLEDQRHPPGKIARLTEVFRRPEQHRRMPVMATGVHLARIGRGIVQPGGFRHRQRIHIRTQADGAALPFALDDRDETRGCDP